ncbi:MAG: elongation factor Ts [Chloroflexi bacterium]|nr:elongation factor Ts [Chloroflexota bacterium]
MIKSLRQETGAGILESKEALAAAGGDMERAREILRQKGLSAAAKVAGREAREGLVEAYIHGPGRMGVLLELNCETDFVARTPEFQTLAHDLALQVAATDPHYISAEDVPPAVWEEEKKNYPSPDDFYKQVCLLSQPFIKDEGITVGEIITQAQAKLGENVSVRRFVRYELGGG